MPTVATTLPPLKPESIRADAHHGYVDGLVVDVRVTYDRGDPSVGIRSGYDAEITGAPRMDSLADWQEAHPGVEPTPEAMRALVQAAAGEIEAQAADAAADIDADLDADDHEGPEWTDDEEGY